MNKTDSKIVKKASILLTQEELDLIDLWRVENRVSSRAAALRALLGRGARNYFDATHQRPPDNDEARLLRGNHHS